MGKNVVVAVSALLALIGILLVLGSPTMSLAAADSWLRNIGRAVDTSRYDAMVTAYGASYRLLGGVLLGGGIFGAFQHIRDTVK